MKRVILIVMIFSMFIIMCGCNLGVDMPFNGVATFHEITITIPDALFGTVTLMTAISRTIMSDTLTLMYELRLSTVKFLVVVFWTYL